MFFNLYKSLVNDIGQSSPGGWFQWECGVMSWLDTCQDWWLRWCWCQHGAYQPVLELLYNHPKHLHSVRSHLSCCRMSGSSMELMNLSCSVGASVSALKGTLPITGAETYSLKWEEPCVYGWLCKLCLQISLTKLDAKIFHLHAYC